MLVLLNQLVDASPVFSIEGTGVEFSTALQLPLPTEHGLAEAYRFDAFWATKTKKARGSMLRAPLGNECAIPERSHDSVSVPS